MSKTASISAPGAVVGAAAERIVPPRKRLRVASVRVSPGIYLATLCWLSFIALLLLRTGFDSLALYLLGLTWLIIPALALTDRVVFDGRSLSRRGFIPLLLKMMDGRERRLNIDEIERVETMAVRTLRRGGRVRYRYRSEVAGKGASFVFASGGHSYRQMIRSLFSLIAEEKLDARSSELRHYLLEPRDLNATVRSLQLASTDVLEGATSDLQPHTRKQTVRRQRAIQTHDEADIERGLLLRLAANQLRAAGRLRQSAEAFRRALLVIPRDGWLLYEFARYLRSQASAMGDARLLTRARAALRLAARRGSGDAALLTRIGESFFEYGEVAQATRIFDLALQINSHAFRAELGLAEISLRSGKLAHVIHHYAGAARIAPDEALARFARREADYYARLNDDDDYLSVELRRIGWLQYAQQARRMSLRLTIGGLLLALVGASFDETLATLGWALSTSAIFAWVLLAGAGKLLARRRKMRPAD